MRNPLALMHVTSPYGPRGSVTLADGTVKPPSHHNGVDLRAPVGMPVFAPVSGRLDKTNETSRGALQAFLAGDDGRRYAFVHLSDVLAPVGSRVVEGQTIALSGDSGGVAPHLHLEVRQGPTLALVDPMTVFRSTDGGPTVTGKKRGGGGGLVLIVGALVASRML